MKDYFLRVFPAFVLIVVAVPFSIVHNIDPIGVHDRQEGYTLSFENKEGEDFIKSSSNMIDSNQSSKDDRASDQERKLHITSDDNMAARSDKDRYKYQPPTIDTGARSLSDTASSSPNQDDWNECGDGPDFDKYFMLDHTRRSNTNEDKKIYERFFKPHIHNGDGRGRLSMGSRGTFVELGAFDGMHETNTRFYEACLGWRGLLIEGNPTVYETLITNRPRAHRMSFAPSCREKGETIKFVDVALTNAGVPGHAKDYDGRKSANVVDVPCGPLSPILEDIFSSSGGHIDFFSLDVEGAEALVLDTIDFEKVRVDIFMIEVENSFCKRNEKCEVRDKVRKKMKEAGYRQKYGVVRRSDVWVHPDSPYPDM